MKIDYLPKNPREKFGMKIYKMLVENYPETYFVGGMVRDLILQRKITDIDIATEAEPEVVVKILDEEGVKHRDTAKLFGVIVAYKGEFEVEIATFREDVYTKTRFPKIKFSKDVETDSKRRDFTINSLYFKPFSGKILDFTNGILDLRKLQLRTVKDPEMSFSEDPLRIIRALRFAFTLNLKIEKETQKAIDKHITWLQSVNKKRVEKEILKIKNKNLQKKVLLTAKLS